LREKYGIQEDEEDDKQEMGSSEGECHCEAGLMALYTESQDEGFPTSAIENLPVSLIQGFTCNVLNHSRMVSIAGRISPSASPKNAARYAGCWRIY
jgi:hypothetical protein